METTYFWVGLIPFLTAIGSKLLWALVVFLIGNILIKAVLKALAKNKVLEKSEGTVRTFLSVSYTHLDVYKRQEQGRRGSVSGNAGRRAVCGKAAAVGAHCRL